MLDDATNVVERGIGQACVAVAREGIVSSLGDGLVNVHAGAVVTHQWLGHEGGGLAVGMSNVEHTVLQDLYFVRFRYQRVELDAYLALAGSTHFVMVNLNLETHLLHRGAHRGANIMK